MIRSEQLRSALLRIPLITLWLSLVGSAAEVYGEVPLSQVRSTSVHTGDVEDMLLADLDGDDDAELLVASGDGVDIYIDESGRGFQKLRPGIAGSRLPSDPTRLGAADFDLDGDNDLLVCGDARRHSPPCRIVWNCLRETGRLGFSCGRKALVLATPGNAFHPLIGDVDGDRDPDVILLPLEDHDDAVIVRNDSHQERGKLTVAPGVLRLSGPVADAATLAAGTSPFKLLVAPRLGPPLLFVYDDATAAFVDRSEQLGLGGERSRWRADRGGRVATGDLNADGLPDIALHDRSGADVLLQDEAGMFHETWTRGLNDLRIDAEGIVVEDFNRDGRADIFVVGEKHGRSRLYINRTTPGGDGAIVFSEQGSAIGLRSREGLASPSLFRAARECDFAIQLAVADQRPRGESLVFTFPDDSRGKTIAANPSQLQTAATFDGACVQGSDGPDTLVGHRLSSVLRGGRGDDTLIARAGLTVMRGGPGVDTFKTAGFTLIQLPADEVLRGEVVDCGHASDVLIDSPLSFDELKNAGVQFIDCGGDGVECDEDHDEAHTRAGGESNDCHHIPLVVTTIDLGLPASARALQFGESLGFVGNDGSVPGTCQEDANCYGIGLDACVAIGFPPSAGETPKCYPSDFNGFFGSAAQWCNDPFWARYRFGQLRARMSSEGRRLVVPVTFWVPRSSASAADGTCAFDGHKKGFSLEGMHESIADVMSGAMSFYGRWGVTFDYQFRPFTVADDSPFVANASDDRCRVALAPSGSEANSIGKLIEQFPDKFRHGEINIYVADVGGVSWSSKATIGGEVFRFILLRGGAGAFSHEMGHGLGLLHPYDHNRSASGTDSGESESRDNWFRRPFPDTAMDRLHVCNLDADCTGVDAGPGDCRKAPGQALGYCRNLKQDCAEDGDHMCDTPWDSAPCFSGVDNNLGGSCSTDADCQIESSNPDRGTSYLTRCGSAGLCVKVECTDSDDCDGGSFCADGTCVIWKPGIGSCCAMHTDRGPGFDHNACYERRPNGTVVPVAGPGPSTYWPLDDNIMAYHRPFGRFRTITDGQRDQIVCKVDYRQDLGSTFRVPHADGEPCTLRTGDDESSYGDPGYSRLIAHGACASGVCQLTHTADGVSAVCVPGSCTDGVKGEGELSLDCGGACAALCPTTRDEGPSTSQCEQDSDCVSDFCDGGTCEPSCEDGEENGVEQGLDSGGLGYDLTCSTQGIGELCRWNEDCTGALACEGKGSCVLSSDCPINDATVACSTEDDCLGDGDCVKSGSCAVATCSSDAMCPSGICILPAGVCRCADDGDCPVSGNACVISQAICLDQCVDGRCLGTCELGAGG